MAQSVKGAAGRNLTGPQPALNLQLPEGRPDLESGALSLIPPPRLFVLSRREVLTLLSKMELHQIATQSYLLDRTQELHDH